MSVRQPKPESAARILSRELAKRGIELQHTHALELLAKVLGHNNAHVMRAKTRGHKRKSKEEASVRRDVLDFLDTVALGNTDPDPLAQTASALLKRIQEGLQADCPIIRVGDPPLSASVLKELEAKDDIRAIVEIEGSELLDENFNLEAFLDHVSERITGSLCGLSDITYKVVHLPNPTPEMVAFEVRAAELNWETIEDDELAKQSPSRKLTSIEFVPHQFHTVIEVDMSDFFDFLEDRFSEKYDEDELDWEVVKYEHDGWSGEHCLTLEDLLNAKIAADGKVTLEDGKELYFIDQHRERWVPSWGRKAQTVLGETKAESQDSSCSCAIDPITRAVTQVNPHCRDHGEHRCECFNCGSIWDIKELNEIKRYWERVEEGEEEPDGECPKCGALCYLIEEDDEEESEVRTRNS